MSLRRLLTRWNALAAFSFNRESFCLGAAATAGATGGAASAQFWVSETVLCLILPMAAGALPLCKLPVPAW